MGDLGLKIGEAPVFIQRLLRQAAQQLVELVHVAEHDVPDVPAARFRPDIVPQEAFPLNEQTVIVTAVFLTPRIFQGVGEDALPAVLKAVAGVENIEYAALAVPPAPAAVGQKILLGQGPFHQPVHGVFGFLNGHVARHLNELENRALVFFVGIEMDELVHTHARHPSFCASRRLTSSRVICLRPGQTPFFS